MAKNQPENPPVLSSGGSRDVGGRFKVGHSGNPAGRPPRAESWSEIFDDELSRLVDYIDGGRTVRINAKRAIVKLLILKALTDSDLRAIKEILDRMMPATPVKSDEIIDLSEFSAILDEKGSGEK